MTRQPNLKRQKIFKNVACLSFCLVVIFTTSIFVSETYYDQNISDTVLESSILKDIYYEDWGVMQSPSPIINKFTPYIYSGNDTAKLANHSTQYQYTFQFKNISFSQGNVGTIKYLNTWERTYVPSQVDVLEVNAENSFLNIQAEKVYNYDYFAPKTRKFALMYNIVFDSLSKDFLSNFYSYYIYEYFFKNFEMVQNRIFSPLGLEGDQAKAIYNHELYGLNNPVSLSQWITLREQLSAKIEYMSPLLNNIQKQLNLSLEQISFIVGQQSTLNNLLTAVKGSIKYKLWSKNYNYQCQSEYCSKEVIAATQLAFGFLTKDGLFADLNLDLYTNELNTTFYDKIEYSAFCESNPDISCLDKGSALGFFVSNYLSNYTEVDFILKSLNKPEVLESRYNLPPQTGQSIAKYVQYLYENVFNIQQESKLVEQPLQKSFTNYNHIQRILDNFKDILYIQLHSRAFFNKFINTTPTKATCESFYTGNFSQYKADCKVPGLDITQNLETLKNYIKAFIGDANSKFFSSSTIPKEKMSSFLHNGEASSFAKQMNQLIADLKENYKCKYACNSYQLMLSQWKDGSIMSNLPKKYFPNTKQSILNWDVNNFLKKVQPQLFNFVKVTAQLNAGEILNSITGVYSLFNLMKLSSDSEGSLYKGIKNSDLLSYLQSVVLDVDFGGIYTQKSSEQFFNGYSAQAIDYKKKMNDTLGGASWMDQKISAITLENKPEKFNFINSGIYKTQKLRTISSVEGSTHSSSEYQIFKSKDEDVSITYITDKIVKGTNLFGFQTKIQEHQSLEGYFDMIYQSQALIYKQNMVWKDSQNREIKVFKFTFADKLKPVQVNIEQLANRKVQLSSDSYFLIEPETGLTMEMYIKYTVIAQPYFLGIISKGKTADYPVYQGQISYKCDKTENIVKINDQKNQLSFLFLMAIIFSSVFMAVFLVSIIMYKRTSDSNKRIKAEKRSLLSSQANTNSALQE